MHLVQISEHLKGVREMMGMVSGREKVNKTKDTEGKLFILSVQEQGLKVVNKKLKCFRG